jgi:hypothetical protein
MLGDISIVSFHQEALGDSYLLQQCLGLFSKSCALSNHVLHLLPILFLIFNYF